MEKIVINDEPTHENEIASPWSLRTFECIVQVNSCKINENDCFFYLVRILYYNKVDHSSQKLN